MAVPKRKVSKARRDKRRSSVSKLNMPGMVECPQCHEMKLAHRICPSCGYYDGKEVLKDGKLIKSAPAKEEKAAEPAPAEKKSTASKSKTAAKKPAAEKVEEAVE